MAFKMIEFRVGMCYDSNSALNLQERFHFERVVFWTIFFYPCFSTRGNRVLTILKSRISQNKYQVNKNTNNSQKT